MHDAYIILFPWVRFVEQTPFFHLFSYVHIRLRGDYDEQKAVFYLVVNHYY